MPTEYRHVEKEVLTCTRPPHKTREVVVIERYDDEGNRTVRRYLPPNIAISGYGGAG